MNEVKYLAMLYNYPYAFLNSKEDISSYGLNEDELENLEYIEVKIGEIE